MLIADTSPENTDKISCSSIQRDVIFCSSGKQERSPRSLQVLLWVNTTLWKCRMYYVSTVSEQWSQHVFTQREGVVSATRGGCRLRTLNAGWDRVVPCMDPTSQEMQWFHLAPRSRVLLPISSLPASPKAELAHVGHRKMLYRLSK